VTPPSNSETNGDDPDDSEPVDEQSVQRQQPTEVDQQQTNAHNVSSGDARSPVETIQLEANQSEDETDETTGELPSAKTRERVIQLYLPDSMSRDWDMAETKLEFKWQEAGGDKNDLEKLRHLHPFILFVGLRNIDEITAQELADFMQEIEQEDATNLG
jgi:hypothetical protein